MKVPPLTVKEFVGAVKAIESLPSSAAAKKAKGFEARVALMFAPVEKHFAKNPEKILPFIFRFIAILNELRRWQRIEGAVGVLGTSPAVLRLAARGSFSMPEGFDPEELAAALEAKL